MSARHRLTHIGLCVRDIERSTEFYSTALDFDEVSRVHVDGPEAAQLLGLPDLSLDLVYLQRDGFRLELLGYVTPPPSEDTCPRPFNQIGLTHLSFLVDDPDVLVERIQKHGGRMLAERTVTFSGGNRGLILTDPDGNLLELIERITS
jgi:glyoxylase I family protein